MLATRVFLAIEPPQRIRDAIAGLLPILPPGMRPSREGQFHLTLAFLGDVPDARLPALAEALIGSCAPLAALRLTPRGLGAFPSAASARVAWVGIEGEGLRSLRDEVARAARRAGCPPGDDRFAPHVTIARARGAGVDLRGRSASMPAGRRRDGRPARRSPSPRASPPPATATRPWRGRPWRVETRT